MTPKSHKAPGWFAHLCARLGVGYKKDPVRQVLIVGRYGKTAEITAEEFETISRHALRRRLERLAA